MKSRQPVVWFNFTLFLNRHYPVLYRHSFGITHDRLAAINFSFYVLFKSWPKKEDSGGHIVDEGLMYDILRDNSALYRLMQIRRPDDTVARDIKEKKSSPLIKDGERIDEDRIYREMLESILNETEKIPRKDRLFLHRIIMAEEWMEQLAKKKNMTINALRIQKSRLITSLFSKLGDAGLLICLYLLFTGHS